MMHPLRSFLNAYPWWRLEPHRDWLLIDGRPSPLPSPADLTPPHCAAISGELYVVYIPRGNESRPMSLANVQTGSYEAAWYDPRTSKKTPLGLANIGQVEWPIPQRPSPAEDDWVLCLEYKVAAPSPGGRPPGSGTT